jgi:transposase
LRRQSRIRKEPVAKPEDITWAGLDVHKNTVAIAAVAGDGFDFVIWQEPNENRAIRRLARQLQRMAGGRVRCCYEAGPTGYALQRQLTALGIDCRVVAPSLTPVKPGARIKTDRRDARKLAELFRATLAN